MTGPGVVIELCGLPGSGKSSVAGEACRALRSAGTDVWLADLPVSAAATTPTRVARRAALALFQLARSPGGSVAAARLVAATRPSLRDGAALLVQLLAVQRLAARARSRGGVALLEEGLVQTLWSIGLRSDHDCADALSRWLAAAPASGLVLLVDAPTGTILDRLSARSSRHSRTQRLAPSDRRAELDHGRRLLDHLVPPSASTLRNDGALPLPQLGRLAAEEVLRVVP